MSSKDALDVTVQRTVFPPGYRGDWHAHPLAQLIYPSRGVMTLKTRSGTWVVPPLRACWLPADEPHQVEIAFGLNMHSAYCAGPGLARLPREPGIVQVSDLFRAAILALEDSRSRSVERLRRATAIFADELVIMSAASLQLPSLGSGRLAVVQIALRRDPADPRGLEAWARQLGMAPRTLARSFKHEARISFTQYRAQVRLHAAMERLAAGASVTVVAHNLGFGSPSAFIAAFRKATGSTPRAYFRKVP